MTNNERFNQMLNSCQNPRRVYNALMAFAETPMPSREVFLADENLRKLARQIMASRNEQQILATLAAVLPPKKED